MFLDLLDTAKTSENNHTADDCRMNAIKGESMLFYLILSGYTPTLTQTQVMDSIIIHDILRDQKNRNYFLKMIQDGYVKVVLYTGNGSRSIQDYFKKSLLYGTDNDSDFFDFSTMPFLDKYNSKTRKNLNQNIIEAIEHNLPLAQTDGVEQEKIDYIDGIIEDIQDMDRAIRGRYLVSSTFKKNIDNLFRIQCQEIIRGNGDPEFVELCKNMIQKDDYHNRRSIYYNYIQNIGNGFSNESIEKIKQVVDNSYNEAIASLLDANGYSLNFTDKFVDLVQPAQQGGKLVKKENLGIRKNNADQYLTWESLYNIMTEVAAIEKNKKIGRLEALNEYKNKLRCKPILAVSKYLGISAIASFIPGIPDVIEIVSDVVSGSVSDMLGEKLKKPGLGEIIGSVKTARSNERVVDKAINFISMSMQ